MSQTLITYYMTRFFYRNLVLSGQSSIYVVFSVSHQEQLLDMSVLVPMLIDFIYHVFLPPFLFVLFLILCLASFGKSLGIRRLYVKWLLKVFKVSYTTQSSICVLCICSAKPIFDNINVFL